MHIVPSKNAPGKPGCLLPRTTVCLVFASDGTLFIGDAGLMDAWSIMMVPDEGRIARLAVQGLPAVTGRGKEVIYGDTHSPSEFSARFVDTATCCSPSHKVQA